MQKGITLLAIGKYSYAYFAFNMALTIKQHSPNIPIQLICEPGLLAPLKEKWIKLFDIITPIKKEDAYFDNKLEPGFAKLNIYKYLAFNETIYLDVDGVCIAPVEPLFDIITKDIHTQVVSLTDELCDEWGCFWMTLEKVKKHYKLPKEFILPEINSSFFYIKKGKLAEKFFTAAQKNFKPEIDKKEFSLTWGARFPDELAFNVAFAQIKHDPSYKEQLKPIYFKTVNEKGTDSLEEIKKKHFFIGTWGSKSFNHSSIVGNNGYYDKIVHAAMVNIMGENQKYKIHALMKDKHVLQKK